jgi:hypothetical protein
MNRVINETLTAANDGALKFTGKSTFFTAVRAKEADAVERPVTIVGSGFTGNGQNKLITSWL